MTDPNPDTVECEMRPWEAVLVGLLAGVGAVVTACSVVWLVLWVTL